MDAGKKSINDIFNGNRILEIPFFQRSYVWGEEQWERLLEDMYQICLTNKTYFLGSVILKQQQTTTSQHIGDKRIVIDGQQRLTTLNIFFKVLCIKCGKDSTFERIFKLLNNEIALIHNYNDSNAFNKILKLDKLNEIDENEDEQQIFDTINSLGVKLTTAELLKNYFSIKIIL